jgi:transcriptional regulator of arginine metabolism
LIPNQEALRVRLLKRGIHVAQATLSRDIRELGLVKRSGPDERSHYYAPGEERSHAAVLQRLLPDLFLRAEGANNLLVLRTRIGGAQSVAAALDGAEWPEVLGTIAGDDTILLVLRRAEDAATVRKRIEGLARSG